MDADGLSDRGVTGAGMDKPDHLDADRRGQRLPAADPLVPWLWWRMRGWGSFLTLRR